jgi:hypothetical protein
MKVLLKSLWLLSLLLGVNVKVCVAAPTPEKAPLCDLQRTARQGEHRPVQISGIYSAGFEGSVLTDAACPSQYTWVELDLKSTANKEKLRSMLNKAGKAEVVFEGEFYGPGMPDPKLPEAIRKSYQPGWGHLAAFKTKLVVHAIRNVKAAPDQTSSTIEALPTIAGAAVPFYPPLARLARVYGTVEVLVAVSNGEVVNAEAKSGHKLLVQATTDNIKTWRFASEVNATFTTKFIYQLDPGSANPPGNSKIELELPSLVKITAVPVVIDCQSQVQSSETLDPKTGNLQLQIPILATTKKQ